jgi:hypothetical protein
VRTSTCFDSGAATTGEIANENFAREFMQLFSTGLYLLDSNGGPELNAQGIEQPVFTEAQVQAYARALTGWTQLNLPSNLFSHADQQLQWQNAAQTAATSTGWAGRMSDLLGRSFNSSASIPMITSVAGNTLFCDGQSTTPLAVSPGNVAGVSCGEGTQECITRQALAQSFLSFESGISLVQADNVISQDANRYASVLTEAVSGTAPLPTVFPSNNPLATQLQQIAQLMQVRSNFGVNRQIFFAGVGNFDTHANRLHSRAFCLVNFPRRSLPSISRRRSWVSRMMLRPSPCPTSPVRSSQTQTVAATTGGAATTSFWVARFGEPSFTALILPSHSAVPTTPT